MKTCNLALTPLHLRASRHDLLSRLADDLAHEIKNPIHAAMINLELIRRRVGDGSGERVLERVGALEEQIGRVHELVDGLLQLMRPAIEEPRPVDLDHEVQELLPILGAVARAARIPLGVEPGGLAPTVRIGRSALRHAILLLVIDALDAARRRGGGPLQLCTGTEPGVAWLRVADAGTAASAAAAAPADPALAARFAGHGSGFAVARALLEEAGGRLDIEHSAGVGGGAVFRLALPGGRA